jgi:predicted amidophosphoribosyltransferase
VFLVDDLLDTGRTMTVVARTLRHFGVGAVYPLVLALAR